ncbi:hypothetical protein HHI36_014694 [Cryptolaemus montrouzieri]|uniref:Uncharacterized protein n=1 Tax=Cryptolaemus montrouzieri TaxID=559131 RepID=A0ABD2N3C3_9CUCU
MEVRQKTAETRNLIRYKKKQSFESFCGNISFTSSHRAWEIVKKFSAGTPIRFQNPSDQCCLNILDTLSLPAPTEREHAINEIASEVFTYREMDISINSKKESAPGLDNMGYIFFKKLPPSAKYLLLDFINMLLNQVNLPSLLITSDYTYT